MNTPAVQIVVLLSVRCTLPQTTSIHNAFHLDTHTNNIHMYANMFVVHKPPQIKEDEWADDN